MVQMEKEKLIVAVMTVLRDYLENLVEMAKAYPNRISILSQGKLHRLMASHFRVSYASQFCHQEVMEETVGQVVKVVMEGPEHQGKKGLQQHSIALAAPEKAVLEETLGKVGKVEMVEMDLMDLTSQ